MLCLAEEPRRRGVDGMEGGVRVRGERKGEDKENRLKGKYRLCEVRGGELGN